MSTVHGTIPARVKSRTTPATFTFTASFVVQLPQTPADVAEHDRQWGEFIARQIARAPRAKATA